MQHSYYCDTVEKFTVQSADEIIGILTAAHHFSLDEAQRDAWREQVSLLQQGISALHGGHIHFEFMIPRMGKRADCLLLYRGIVFVIEFKVGASGFDRHAREQVHDYALDLKNFHHGSHDAAIVPVLIATKARASVWDVVFAEDGVAAPVMLSPEQLCEFILSVSEQSTSGVPVWDHGAWLKSGYRPTPTIIEAARTLYAEHQVENIACFDAGQQNLNATNAYVGSVIEDAKANRRKAICFITGVPGAGKTLAGLNIATQRAEHGDEHAVFLSGNGPLVTVLREALARDQAAREKIKKKDADRKVSSFVQNIHHFRDDNLKSLDAPFEKVVVFDEAQRAWTREQASKFMKTKRGQSDFDASEPEFLIGVMDRHQQWCVVICLIGGGQEINTGEAGIGEWLRGPCCRRIISTKAVICIWRCRCGPFARKP